MKHDELMLPDNMWKWGMWKINTLVLECLLRIERERRELK